MTYLFAYQTAVICWQPADYLQESGGGRSSLGRLADFILVKNFWISSSLTTFPSLFTLYEHYIKCHTEGKLKKPVIIRARKV